MAESRQLIFLELTKLRALPPLGECSSQGYENVDVLFEEIDKFREYMSVLKREIKHGLECVYWFDRATYSGISNQNYSFRI